MAHCLRFAVIVFLTTAAFSQPSDKKTDPNGKEQDQSFEVPLNLNVEGDFDIEIREHESGTDVNITQKGNKSKESSGPPGLLSIYASGGFGNSAGLIPQTSRSFLVSAAALPNIGAFGAFLLATKKQQQFYNKRAWRLGMEYDFAWSGKRFGFLVDTAYSLYDRTDTDNFYLIPLAAQLAGTGSTLLGPSLLSATTYPVKKRTIAGEFGLIYHFWPENRFDPFFGIAYGAGGGPCGTNISSLYCNTTYPVARAGMRLNFEDFFVFGTANWQFTRFAEHGTKQHYDLEERFGEIGAGVRW